VTQLQKFVETAREHGLSDEMIRQSLLDQGWPTSQVDAGLLGLEVPRPDAATTAPAPVEDKQRQPTHPSLSPLQAALLHVLLWFFAASSTVAIIGVVASLFGESISTEALASMIAVTIITFVPYAVFFVLYLKRLAAMPNLVPGKIWSIITICLFSIGAMSAAIALVISLIRSDEASFAVGSVLIVILNAIVLMTYSLAAFRPPSKGRTLGLRLHLILLAILLGGLFVASLVRIGPARADEQLRQDLVATVDSVRSYAQRHDALPDNGTGIVADNAIEYKKTGAQTYELCATFKLDNAADYSHYSRSSSNTVNDAYVYESQFRTDSGRRCFGLLSSSLDSKDSLSEEFSPSDIDTYQYKNL
jgi:hypothetical protein